MMLNKQIVSHNDKLFIIKRTINESCKPKVDTWKEHLHADLVLRKDGILYFVEEVQEPLILEEISNNKLKNKNDEK